MKKYFALICLIAITSCTSTHEIKGNIDDYDPLETYNRGMSKFNDAVDYVVLEPVAQSYRFVTNDTIRKMIRNVISNLKQPVYFANNVLQGDISGAGINFQRFFANTFIGVAGIFDIASYEGIEKDKEDFGQTLAVWGIGSGPYFVLPILGPSSVRDAIGLGVDRYINPINRYATNVNESEIIYIKSGVEGISLREENIETLNSLRETSVDFYSTMKSIYRQRRTDAISDGTYQPDFPEFE